MWDDLMPGGMKDMLKQQMGGQMPWWMGQMKNMNDIPQLPDWIREMMVMPNVGGNQQSHSHQARTSDAGSNRTAEPPSGNTGNQWPFSALGFNPFEMFNATTQPNPTKQTNQSNRRRPSGYRTRNRQNTNRPWRGPKR